MSIEPSLELAGLIEGYRRFRETGWTPPAASLQDYRLARRFAV